MQTTLPPQARITHILEIESTGPDNGIGTLEWSINGKPAPTLPLLRKPDAEPSDDARFASLVCAFTEWISGDSPSQIDADLLTALARELVSDTLPPEQTDFLMLIDQAVHLK